MQFSDFGNSNENINQIDYSTKLKDLQDTLPGILDDFKKYYVFYHKNPDYSEYQSNFENAKNNLNDNITKIFKLSTQVNSSTQNINSKLQHINHNIEKNKEIYSKLKYRVMHLKNSRDTSDILIDEYVTIYNIYYLKNAAIFLGILLEFWILMKTFNYNSNPTPIS